MGYRSEVLCAVGFPTRDKLVGYMTLHRLKSYPHDTRQLLDEFIIKAKIIEGDGYAVAFHQYESIKWYENYEDVQIITQFITGVCEHDNQAVGKIARVGEEQSDIQNDTYDQVTDLNVAPEGTNDVYDALDSLFYPVSYVCIDIPEGELKQLKTIGELHETK
jgi:hypothetical protein